MTAPSTFSEHSSDSEPSDTPPAGADEVVADRANRGRWARRLAVAAVVAGAAAALIYGGPSDAARSRRRPDPRWWWWPKRPRPR